MGWGSLVCASTGGVAELGAMGLAGRRCRRTRRLAPRVLDRVHHDGSASHSQFTIHTPAKALGRWSVKRLGLGTSLRRWLGGRRHCSPLARSVVVSDSVFQTSSIIDSPDWLGGRRVIVDGQRPQAGPRIHGAYAYASGPLKTVARRLKADQTVCETKDTLSRQCMYLQGKAQAGQSQR